MSFVRAIREGELREKGRALFRQGTARIKEKHPLRTAQQAIALVSNR
jgi:hypothetical protein